MAISNTISPTVPASRSGLPTVYVNIAGGRLPIPLGGNSPDGLADLIGEIRRQGPVQYSKKITDKFIASLPSSELPDYRKLEIRTNTYFAVNQIAERMAKLPDDPEKLKVALAQLFGKNPVHAVAHLAKEGSFAHVIADQRERRRAAEAAKKLLDQIRVKSPRENLAKLHDPTLSNEYLLTALYPTEEDALPLEVDTTPIPGKTIAEIDLQKLEEYAETADQISQAELDFEDADIIRYSRNTRGGLVINDEIESLSSLTPSQQVQRETPPPSGSAAGAIAGDLAQAGVEKAGKEIGGKVLTKLVAKEATKKVVAEVASDAAAAALAPTGPGALVAKAVTWVAVELASKIPLLIKKYWKELAFGGLFVGAATGSAAIFLVSLPPAALALGAGGAFGLGYIILRSVSSLFKSAFVTISIVAIIVIISIPLLVVLIIFIINSGAYVTPQGGTLPGMDTGTTITSPYLSVTKTAEPSKARNDQLPLTVVYTVTISAKKGTLSNIRIEERCTMDTAALRGEICPGAIPLPPPDPPGRSQAIPRPGDPGYPTTLAEMQGVYTFKYSRTYSGDSAKDSINIDTVTVTADHPEQANTVAAASAAVIIGNPPSECPMGWPTEGTHTITQGPGGEHSGWNGLGAEAIDISVVQGTEVRARHNGTAKVYRGLSGDNYGPNLVEITSNCNGTAFRSLYAHLSSVSISDGPVNYEDVVGGSGTAGTGAHLHYEFVGLPMTNPYIPRGVTYGCKGTCGDTTPAN